MSERVNLLTQTIRQAVASLDFHPTSLELVAAIGQLLVEWGEYLYRRHFPGMDPRDLETVEKQHYDTQDLGCAMILQGHIMQGVWAASRETPST